MEDVGIRPKRFAGVSIGASLAGFLSVGFTSEELVALYLQDLSIFIRGKLNSFTNQWHVQGSSPQPTIELPIDFSHQYMSSIV